MSEIKLHGRVVVRGNIETITGLRIGGRPTGIEIGGVDNIVLRNPVNGHPYVPGSSLKGKMRALLSRAVGAKPNNKMDPEGKVKIHSCHESSQKDYDKCKVCPIFGMPAEGDVRAPNPTPLVVRDVPLWLPKSAEEAEGHADYLNVVEQLKKGNYTEVKWEAVIDRITSAAMPRQMERVPAGAIFRPFEIVYNIYTERTLKLLPYVFLALQLVEDDYLGGQGSRGSGKVAFTNLEVASYVRDETQYIAKCECSYGNLGQLIEDELLLQTIKNAIPIEG